jgi:hypothetical protein
MTADSKTVTTNVNTPIDVTLSGSDSDNDPITFSIVDRPCNKTIVPGKMTSSIKPPLTRLLPAKTDEVASDFELSLSPAETK